jgi:hypothetical protein
MFDGVDNTIVTLRTRSQLAGFHTWDEDVILANGSVTSANHLYEILLYPDRCVFLIDRQTVGTIHDRHLPDPYRELAWWLWSGNSGVVGAMTYIRGDWTLYSNYNDLRVASLPPSTDSTGAVGYVQSLPAPNPSAIEGAVLVPLDLEPDHALRTRSRVLTDEGSFEGNFPGASIYRDLTVGTSITFTIGSVLVTGVGTLFTTEIRVGDYVQYTNDADETAPVQAQVDSIESDTRLTLRTAYIGAGGTSGAGPGVADVCDWYVFADGIAGTSVTVAAGMATLAVGVSNLDRAFLARRLGAGRRKGYAPVRASFRADITARRANQGALLCLSSTLGAGVALTEVAGFLLDGVLTPVVDTLAYRNYAGGIGSNVTEALPNGGDTVADVHVYDLDLYEDRVVISVDGEILRTVGEAIPWPYTEMYLLVQIENVGATAATSVNLIDAHCKSLDVVDVRSVQPDASKLQMTAHDGQPCANNTPRAPTNIADNLVHEITLAAGAGMQLGHKYEITQIGGADIQIYITDAGAPAIAVLRYSPHHLFNGIPWQFSPTIQGQRIYAGKAVNGTANADIYCDSPSGGAGA